MEHLVSLTRSRDTTGRTTRQAVHQLAHLSSFLSTDPDVHNYVLGPQDPAADLAYLLSPQHVAAAATFTFDCLESASTPIDQRSLSSWLLVPVTTRPPLVLGIVANRDDYKALGPKATASLPILLSCEVACAPVHTSESTAGRFAYNPSTGELAAYTRLPPVTVDIPFAALVTLGATCSPPSRPPAVSDFARTRARVLWWGSQSTARDPHGRSYVAGTRRGRLSALVDDELFRELRFRESLLATCSSSEIVRKGCADCLSDCACVDVMSGVPDGAALTTMMQGLRALRGKWVGATDLALDLPGMDGPPVVVALNFDMGVSCHDDAGMRRSLRDSALSRAICSSRVPRGMPGRAVMLDQVFGIQSGPVPLALEGAENGTQVLNGLDLTEALGDGALGGEPFESMSTPQVCDLTNSVTQVVDGSGESGSTLANRLYPEARVPPAPDPTIGTEQEPARSQLGPGVSQRRDEVQLLTCDSTSFALTTSSLSGAAGLFPVFEQPAQNRPETTLDLSSRPGASRPSLRAGPGKAHGMRYKTQREREEAAAARKQRNREAAARSNRLRRDQASGLINALKVEKNRVLELKERELALRGENIGLRTAMQMRR